MKGVIDLNDTFILIFSVLFVVGIFLVAAVVVVDTTVDTEVKSDEAYSLMTVTERIMNSPCTTVDRGVFSDERLRSGNLDCLELEDVFVNVQYRDCIHEFSEMCRNVFRLDGDEVEAMTNSGFHEETRWENGTVRGRSIRYPATIYSEERGEYHQATMEVVIK